LEGNGAGVKEGNGAGVKDDAGTNLDQFEFQAGQRLSMVDTITHSITQAGKSDRTDTGRRVGKQLGVVERAGLREVAGSFIHVDCVPERDGGDDEIERHGPLLLGGVRAIMNAPL
jgi:hypothetical protein